MRRVLLAFILALNLLLCTNSNKSSATAFQLIAAKSEARSDLIGKWQVQTKVIWSDCEYVSKGLESESRIVIHSIGGKLFPKWEAYDWELVRNKAIDFGNDDSLHWEIETKLERDGDYWFVRAINDFKLDKHGHVTGKGVVKQYLNGEFVGSYITESTLSKLAVEEKVKLSSL
jgi:hypothetical protein